VGGGPTDRLKGLAREQRQWTGNGEDLLEAGRIVVLYTNDVAANSPT
jgi:hypothetical protein